MADCTNCKYEQLINQLIEDNNRNRVRHKEFYRHIQDSQRTWGSLEEWQKRIFDELTVIKTDVAELKNKPVKRYENVLGSVVQWRTLLVLGLLAAKWGIM